MESAKKIISRREFEWLSQFKNHTPEEAEKMKIFLDEREKKRQFKKPEKPKLEFIDGHEPSKANIWKLFLNSFQKENKKPFQQTTDSLLNIEPIIKYFSQDPTFFECKNLITHFEGANLSPNFKKGLLVVGMYGNGKTAIFKALSKGFLETTERAKKERWKTARLWNELRFNSHNANDVVTDYECIKKAEYKEEFYRKYSGFRLYFDDFKNEKMASNFGKTEIFREILEKRYNLGSKTFLTMNYEQDYPENLSASLDAVGKRYGAHIYDRIFEMFNIIEFKGKSFRI